MNDPGNTVTPDNTLDAAPPSGVLELGRVLVPLLKGVVHEKADPARWTALLTLQSRVRDHVAAMGLVLMLDEAEGYAFLRSIAATDSDELLDESGNTVDTGMPRLIARRPLSFPVSLLLALLRKRMVEFDAGGEETRLILTRDEIANLLQLFLPERSDEARLADQIDTHINKYCRAWFPQAFEADSRQRSRDPALRGATNTARLRRCAVAW